MAENRSARRGGRAASGGFAGQRNNPKHTKTWTDFQQPLGSICCYEGRTYIGAVVPQRGRWLAVDAHGHRVGVFDLRHRAEHALFQGQRLGGAHE